MTTRYYFTKKARTDIWAEGKLVKKVHKSGKHAGQEYEGRDTSRPSGKDDRLIVSKGESYYWWKFAFGPKIISKVKPRRSQLTRSAFLSDLYDFQDGADQSTASSVTDLESLKDEWVLRLEEMRDMCQDSLDNMPEQLRESSESGMVLQDRIEQLDDAINSLESVDVDADELSPSEFEDEVRSELDGGLDEGEEVDESEVNSISEERADEAFQERINDILDELKECYSNIG